MIKITVPADKSISHRAAIIGAICKKPLRIRNYLRAGDTLSTLSCLKELGIGIEDKGEIEITSGELKKPKASLDCGNSGTTMRLLMGLLSAQPFEATLTGDASLSLRPMERVAKPLKIMGARITTNKGRPPVTVIGGRLSPISYELPVPSAQIKSAILLAGLFAEGKTIVIEPNICRDHTERMLEALGAPIRKEGLKTEIEGPADLLGGETITVPGDFSSAAFFIVASIIAKKPIEISNVGINPTRTGLLDVLRKMGAEIEIRDERCEFGEHVADIITKGGNLSGVELKEDLVPLMIDEIPILTIAALFADGRTTIKGAAELRVKESDRIKAMVNELRKLGADIEELLDGMVIKGGAKLKGAEVSSYHDHRIAMSLSVLGLLLPDIKVIDSECVNISFPDFFQSLSFLK
ncbi:MAG: 3-phosphoshikimate 1-carboxyvinyltransferase [bacterium]|nr:3-phosphoshikimate 1-carboxyvinyltransferase [bacterium]